MADRITITMEEEQARDVRAAAADAGMSVSAWLGEAAARALRHQGLGAWLAEWEAEHGAFTEEELEAASERLRARPAQPA